MPPARERPPGKGGLQNDACRQVVRPQGTEHGRQPLDVHATADKPSKGITRQEYDREVADGNFWKCWEDLIFQSKLTTTEIALAFAVRKVVDWDTGDNMWAGTAHIAEMINASDSGTRAARRRFVNLGFLILTRKGKPRSKNPRDRNDTYAATIPRALYDLDEVRTPGQFKAAVDARRVAARAADKARYRRREDHRIAQLEEPADVEQCPPDPAALLQDRPVDNGPAMITGNPVHRQEVAVNGVSPLPGGGERLHSPPGGGEYLTHKESPTPPTADHSQSVGSEQHVAIALCGQDGTIIIEEEGIGPGRAACRAFARRNQVGPETTLEATP